MVAGTGRDRNDDALERHWLQQMSFLGARRYTARLARPWAGAKLLVCSRGVVAADAGVTWDVTDECLHEWETLLGPTGTGDLVRIAP